MQILNSENFPHIKSLAVMLDHIKDAKAISCMKSLCAHSTRCSCSARRSKIDWKNA